MADDLKYGYKGAEPTQSFGNNTGVFDPNDINNLIADNKWTQYGQLELIDTQTVSTAVAQVDFTSIQESTYNVHFLTVNNVQFSGTNIANVGVRLFESGVLETSTVYDIAYQRGSATGSTTETRSTSNSHLRIVTYTGDGNVANGYSYFYNLGDSTKYSFHTMHSSNTNKDDNASYNFGSGVLHQASLVDGIRLYDASSGQNITSGVFSLYGIKEYL